MAFKVPRRHEVREVIGNHPRYSIFGWFLKATEVSLKGIEKEDEEIEERNE